MLLLPSLPSARLRSGKEQHARARPGRRCTRQGCRRASRSASRAARVRVAGGDAWLVLVMLPLPSLPMLRRRSGQWQHILSPAWPMLRAPALLSNVPPLVAHGLIMHRDMRRVVPCFPCCCCPPCPCSGGGAAGVAGCARPGKWCRVRPAAAARRAATASPLASFSLASSTCSEIGTGLRDDSGHLLCTRDERATFATSGFPRVSDPLSALASSRSA